MRNIHAMKGGMGALALVIAASFLLLLPGCQGPTGPLETRTGTVSLTVEQADLARAIQPDIGLTDFTKITAEFTHSTHGTVEVDVAPATGTATVTLALGDGWSLTVNAYIGANVAATRTVAVNVVAGFTGVNVTLLPLSVGNYQGTFEWDLTFPDTVIGVLIEVMELAYGEWKVVDYAEWYYGDEYAEEGEWASEMDLYSGDYLAVIRLTKQHGISLDVSMYLHVYRNMTSRFVWEFEEDDFPTVAQMAIAAIRAAAATWTMIEQVWYDTASDTLDEALGQVEDLVAAAIANYAVTTGVEWVDAPTPSVTGIGLAEYEFTVEIEGDDNSEGIITISVEIEFLAEGVVSRVPLYNAIAAANAIVTAVSEDGNNVPLAEYWTTQAVRTPFTDAIATAEAVYNNAAATQAMVTGAIAPLNDAVGIFNAARRPGLQELNAAITAANARIQDNYTPESWGPFYTARAAAIAAHGNAALTREQLQGALNALNAATLVPVGPTTAPAPLVGTPPTITRESRDVIVDGLVAAGYQAHFGYQSTGETTTVDGVNVVYGITGNQAGFRVLAPNTAGVQPGDRIIVVGRTSHGFSGGLDLATMAALHTHLARWGAGTAGVFEIELLLTAPMISAGIGLVSNQWAPHNRPDNFTFSLEDVIVYRPAVAAVELPLSGWIFNTGTYPRLPTWNANVMTGTTLSGHEGLGVFHHGTWGGTASATWVAHDNSLSLRIAAYGTPANFGLQIRAGLAVGDTLTVTGRVSAPVAPASTNRAMVIVNSGGFDPASNQMGFDHAVTDEPFTLTLPVVQVHTEGNGVEIRVHNNAGTVEAFYIDSITFYRPAAAGVEGEWQAVLASSLIGTSGATVNATPDGLVVTGRGTGQHSHNNGLRVFVTEIRELGSSPAIVITGIAENAAMGPMVMQGVVGDITGAIAPADRTFTITIPYANAVDVPDWLGGGLSPVLASENHWGGGPVNVVYDFTITSITVGGVCIRALLAGN